MTSSLFLNGNRTKIFCEVIKVWYITMVYEDQQKHKALLIRYRCFLLGSYVNTCCLISEVLPDPNLHFSGKENAVVKSQDTWQNAQKYQL